MKIWWSASCVGNVGDDLNPYMWPKLFGPGFFDEQDSSLFLGVGSVLSVYSDFAKAKVKKTVFGVGARSSWTMPKIDSTWDIRFVRGPKTATLIGGGVKSISDPAIMLPHALPAHDNVKDQKRASVVGFVPYFRTPDFAVEKICAALNWKLVSPHLEPEAFISKLTSCDFIVAEAMHGAILADSYRVPWIGVRIFNELFEGPTSRFKWSDWLQSLDLCDSNVLQISPSSLRFVRKGLDRPVRKFIFSAYLRDRVLDQIIARLEKEISSDPWVVSNSGVLEVRRELIFEEIERLMRS